jgi:hypothetical protein
VRDDPAHTGVTAGSVYLDLQNRARRERRGTQELLTLYVVERWLARLSASPHASKFIIKGGMLLAAYDARRPTADLDALARSMADDQATVVSLVSEVADLPLDDGVEFRTATASSRTIREQTFYSGVRIATEAAISTAMVKFRMDVNFGDPITPAPGWVTVPPLRPDMEPVRVLGYPIETVLAEKITTAIDLGPANTRVRDYADIYTLTGIHILDHRTTRQALLATAAHRGTPIQPLSAAAGDFARLRSQAYEAYRAGLGNSGLRLPADLESLVTAVTAFADPPATSIGDTTWQPGERRWRQLPN